MTPVGLCIIRSRLPYLLFLFYTLCFTISFVQGSVSLGGNCTDVSNCTASNAVCDSVCKCEPGYFQNANICSVVESILPKDINLASGLNNIFVQWNYSALVNISFFISCNAVAENYIDKGTSTSHNCSYVDSGSNYTISIIVHKSEANSSITSKIGQTLLAPVNSTSLITQTATSVAFAWVSSTTNGVNYTINCTIGSFITSTSYTCTNLISGTEYSISIAATKPSFPNSLSYVFTAKTDLIGVNKSSIVWLPGSSKQHLYISWNASITPNVLYSVYCGLSNLIDNISTNFYNCTGLQPGTIYNISIIVTKATFPNSTAATINALTKPALPSMIQFSYNLNSFKVSWSLNSSNGADNSDLNINGTTFLVPYNNGSYDYAGPTFLPSTLYHLSFQTQANKSDIVQLSEQQDLYTYTNPSFPVLKMLNITDNSAVLDITHSSAFDYFSYNYTGSPDFKNTTSLSVLLSPLLPYSTYQVLVVQYFKSLSSTAVNIVFKTLSARSSAPRSLNLTSQNASSVFVSWLQPEKPNGLILYYIVKYDNSSLLLSSSCSASGEKNTVSNSTEIVLNGLCPGVAYTVSVTAWVDSVGTGNSSDLQTLLLPDLLSSSVTELNVESKAFTFTANWKSPNESSGVVFEHLAFIDYVNNTNSNTKCLHLLKFICNNCNRSFADIIDSSKPTYNNLINSKSCSNSSNQTYLFGNSIFQWNSAILLIPYTNYNITIYPINRAGVGTKMSHAFMSKETPSEPVTSVVLNSTYNSLYFSFEPPKTTNGLVVSYVGKLYNSSSECLEAVVWNINNADAAKINSSLINSLTSTCAINNKTFSVNQIKFESTYISLKPFTNYTLQIFPFSQFFIGNVTNRTHATQKYFPFSPQNFAVNNTGDTWIQLRWEKPLEIHDSSFQYILNYPTINLTSEEKSYNYSSLQQCSLQSYNLIAYNTYGNSSVVTTSGNTLIGTTELRVLKLLDKNSTSLSLDWEHRRHGNCSLTYIVKTNDNSIPTYSGTSNFTIFSGLKPYTDYLVTGYTNIVYNSDNKTNQIFSTTFKTDSKPPSPCRNFICVLIPLKYNAVTCTWEKPIEPNGVIYGYEISISSVTKFVVGNETNTFIFEDTNAIKPDISLRFIIRAKSKGSDTREHDGEVANSDLTIPSGPPYITHNGSSLNTMFKSAVSNPDGSHHQVQLNLPLLNSLFTDQHGSLIKRYILVGTPSDMNNIKPNWNEVVYNETQLEAIGSWSSSKSGTNSPYKIDIGFSGGKVFVIGSDSGCSAQANCNGPLDENTAYVVAVLVCTKRFCTALGFADVSTQVNSGLLAVKVIIPILILLLLALLVVFLLYRRGVFGKKKDSTKNETRLSEIASVKPTLHIPSVSRQTFTSDKHDVFLADFSAYVADMLKDSEFGAHQQFEELRDGQMRLNMSYSAAELQKNRTKNRYIDILPYDNTRVLLEASPEDELSNDYINANYVKGLTSPREYIAAQGPLATTVDDFWRLIYEQNVHLVVMLTQVREKNRDKCQQYWPNEIEQIQMYGNISVTLLSESTMGYYIVRRLTIACSEDLNQTQPKEVVQLHYMKWDDHNVPSLDELGDFIKNMRSYVPARHRMESCPLLVHCSAGVGRTGTLIALDMIVRSIIDNNSESIDVFDTILNLRKHRKNMVQTLSQLAFIYKFLANFLQHRNNDSGSNDTGLDEVYANTNAAYQSEDSV